MPYNSNQDLPPAVRNNLPEHAQTIFREAYNNAHKQYGEERGFKIAWAAVERKYEKNSAGKWVEKK